MKSKAPRQPPRETLLARSGRENFERAFEFTGLEAGELAAAGGSALAVGSLDACGDTKTRWKTCLAAARRVLDRLALAEA